MALILFSPLVLESLLSIGQLYYFSTLSALCPSPLYNLTLGDQEIDALSRKPWSYYHTHITLGLLLLVYWSPLYIYRHLSPDLLIAFLLLGLFWVKLDLDSLWIWDPIEFLALGWLASFLTLQHRALKVHLILPFIVWLCIFFTFYYLPSLHWSELIIQKRRIGSKRKLRTLIPFLFYNTSDLSRTLSLKGPHSPKRPTSSKVLSSHLFLFLVYLKWVKMVFSSIVIDIRQAFYLAGTSA